MGNAFSATGGTGQSVRVWNSKKSKCSRVPPYADRRVWALKELYKISDVNDFPPQIYSAADAEADIKACIGGYRLPSSWKVVSAKKIEELKGKDLRAYALKKYHGYDIVDQRTLQLLPYSKQNAVRDVQYYKKYRQPYFVIDKLQSIVRSRDGKITRRPGEKGTSLNYKYNRSNIGKKGKFAAGKKYDPKKYPLQTMKDGSVGRVIPCSVDPSQCVPGQTTFVNRDVSDILKRAALVDAKSKKQQLRMLQTTHAKKIAALNKKIASAPPELRNRLAKQRQNLQLKFRLNTAKAEQTNRVTVKNSKSEDWKKKRAELGRQKQAKKLAEKQRLKQIEAERRAAAEKKAREDAALRAARQQKKSGSSQRKQEEKRKQEEQRKLSAQRKQEEQRKLSAQRKQEEQRKLSAERKKQNQIRKAASAQKQQQRSKTNPAASTGAFGRYSPIRPHRNPGSIGPFGKMR